MTILKFKKLKKQIFKNYQIAIDGPAGSGKSTISKKIAERFGILYIDSGAMYRAVTYYLIKNGLIDLRGKSLKSCLGKIKIHFKKRRDGIQEVFLNNKNVTNEIRTQSVTNHVSEISAVKEVRKELVKRQQEFGTNSSIVMDGRDIGTKVFPFANLKIYLTASSLVRAQRRKVDLKTAGNIIKLKEIEKQIIARDKYDTSRNISPLVKPQDAVVIDSSCFSVNEVLDQISSFLPENIVNS